MGAKKTTNQTSNQYQYMEPPKSPYVDKYENSLKNLDLTSPVHQGYGRAENLIRESGNDIFGANTSPEMAQKVRENRLFRNQIDKGVALSNAVAQENNIRSGGYMTLADATRPQLVQTGGTSTMTQPFDWGGLASAGLMGAASIGSAGTSSIAGQAVKA